jgi:hypothetical protein
MTTTERPPRPFSGMHLAQAVEERLRVDPSQGMDTDDAARRLAEHGPNELPTGLLGCHARTGPMVPGRERGPGVPTRRCGSAEGEA